MLVGVMFSENVCESLGNYVYRLIDPRNGETFYVGKGQGNRLFAHVQAELRLEKDEDDFSEKIERIRSIRNEGLEVVHVIHRHNIPNEAVFDVEAALIDAYPGLTNDQGGYGSSDRGPMNAQQIINKYDLPELNMNPGDKLVLINVNAIKDKTNHKAVLHQVQYAWKIDVNRAKKADYVLAVQRGVVIGVFKKCEWLPATPEHFPNREEIDGRYGFIGEPADEGVWEYYVGQSGKRVINPGMKHVQNPIRYWNI